MGRVQRSTAAGRLGNRRGALVTVAPIDERRMRIGNARIGEGSG